MRQAQIGRLLSGFLLSAVALLGACTAVPPATWTFSPSAAPDYVSHSRQAAALLDETLAAYREGDAQAALDLAAEAYIDHFEVVEHSLAELDEPFMLELEQLIAVELRQAISAGEPVDAVAELVADAKMGLERVAEMLR